MPTRQTRFQQPKTREAWMERFRLESNSADPDWGVLYARIPGDPNAAVQPPSDLNGAMPVAERGQIEAMHLTALKCDDRIERLKWLTKAAEGGWVPAMHDLGLACTALHERRRWLLRAAQHGWAEAAAELGDVECS